jgi:N-acetylglucosaminyldiphosphoundecaprenol N-acetyl-beta-D-mannosaminyltransferase
VGGTLDYLAGVQRRAPALLRRLWLDWAFRLVTQPWRWRRMLALPRFVLAVLRERA